ncbi:Hypothetical predicted protein [Olea europaea subsp. europaea]|uniref:Uncharacterized protein n=1 Tax=Olea europaea subsp. europaea TaxID=158383 RepID=A0A8S0PNK7_OLEEU|nr:Hypothetical predicted protein [Olea europaea subsp. europaea]
MPENQAATLPWPGCIPDMACTLCPRNCLEMLENQVASLPHPGHGLQTVSQKLPTNAWKSGCIPAVAPTHPEHCLDTATSLPRARRGLDTDCIPSPRNYLQMPKNQVASLPQLGRVPDVASIPCSKTSQKCLKIRLRLCHGPDASRSWPVHCIPETTQKYLKINLRPRRVLDMSCIPYPRNCLEMIGNQVASLPRPRRVLGIACTPC